MAYNNKGQFVQMTFLLVLVFALVIGYLVLNYATQELNDSIQGESDIDSSAKQVSEEVSSSFPNVFDASLGLVLVVGLLVCLGLAWTASNNPMMLVIALFVIVALGVAGMILSNTWEDFSGEDELSSSGDSFPITNFFLNNYLTVVLVFGFLTLTVYAVRTIGGY